MESTKPGIATKTLVARHCDPSVVPHDLPTSLLHRALPAGRDVCNSRSYPLGIEIADLACFHATPRYKEQKEMVDPRRGLSPICRTAPVHVLSVAAILR